MESGKWKATKIEGREAAQVVVVQVNGKVRGRLQVKENLPEEEVVRLALDEGKVKKYIDKAKIKKTVFVQGKLINFVTQ